MSNIATATLSGRITKTPVCEETRNGNKILKFSIAVNQWDSLSKEEVVHYFDCVAFTHNATWIEKTCDKGTLVCLQVTPKQDRWTDKNTGKARSRISFIVNNVEVLTKYSKGDEPQEPQSKNNEEVPF